MYARDLSSKSESNTAKPQDCRDRPHTEEKGTWQRGTLAQVISLGAGNMLPRAHTAPLRRGKSTQPRLVSHYLLQLQRRYGNHHVQRVLALAGELRELLISMIPEVCWDKSCWATKLHT